MRSRKRAACKAEMCCAAMGAALALMQKTLEAAPVLTTKPA
jgi:hypothetical protein